MVEVAGRSIALNKWYNRKKRIKYNVGLDATLFGGLTLTADAFYEKRQDIWVYTGGKNSSILGATAFLC